MAAQGRLELLREVTRQMARAGVPNAEVAARYLVSEVLQCPLAHIAAYPHHPVSDEEAVGVRKAAGKCSRREPIQYALRYAYFGNLRLKVTPAVLIPRPETEQLVDLVLEHVHAKRSCKVLDIGTGSGCIALAIKHACPDVQVLGCDTSQAALDVAAGNALSCGLDIGFQKADILEPEDIGGLGKMRFDVIVSNPPYIPDRERASLQPEVRDHEPAVALFCGADPLKFYRAVMEVVRAGTLNSGGSLFVECHQDHALDVADLFQSAGGTCVRVEKDLAGMNRFVVACFN